MAQIGASIEYETAPPPAGLPDEMHALPGASLPSAELAVLRADER